jgi:hypothetical protein
MFNGTPAIHRMSFPFGEYGLIKTHQGIAVGPERPEAADLGEQLFTERIARSAGNTCWVESEDGSHARSISAIQEPPV